MKDETVFERMTQRIDDGYNPFIIYLSVHLHSRFSCENPLSRRSRSRETEGAHIRLAYHCRYSSMLCSHRVTVN